MPKKTTLANKLQKVKKIVWTPQPSILLSGNIPMPMHGVAPRMVLGSKWWNAERKKCYQSTAYHCLACGTYKYDAKYRRWLEAHETYEINFKKGTMKYLCSVPLCHLCHNYIHDGRLQNLLLKGKISHKKYTSIIQHGDDVLLTANLKRPSKEEREARFTKLLLKGDVAPWEEWRLVIGHQKFPPKFKSGYALQKAFK